MDPRVAIAGAWGESTVRDRWNGADLARGFAVPEAAAFEEPAETIIVEGDGPAGESDRMEGPVFGGPVDNPRYARSRDDVIYIVGIPIKGGIVNPPPGVGDDGVVDGTGRRCEIKKPIPEGLCGDGSGPCRGMTIEFGSIWCYEYYRHPDGNPCDHYYACEGDPGAPSPRLELSPGLRDILDPCFQKETCDGRGRAWRVVDRELKALGAGSPSSGDATTCEGGTHYRYLDVLTRAVVGTVLCCPCCTPDRVLVPAVENCVVSYT